MFRTLSIHAAAATAIAASLAFVQPVFAAGEGHIDGDTMGFMLSPNGGKYYMGRLKSTVVNEALRDARPLPGGVAVVRNNGRFYVVDDPRGTLYRMQMDVAGGN